MTDILPITVVVAISLFIIKEFLELIKKRNEKLRKIKAMKSLFAEEIESNHWVWIQMNSLFDGIKSNVEYSDKSKFYVRVSRSGIERFECIRPERPNWGQSFPKVQERIYQNLSVAVASIDKKFYNLLSSCYQSIAEMKHIRDGIYLYVDDEGSEKDFREGFLEYADNCLPDVYTFMNEFYNFCTGNKLKSFKIR